MYNFLNIRILYKKSFVTNLRFLNEFTFSMLILPATLRVGAKLIINFIEL